jgi:hypothetical protein
MAKKKHAGKFMVVSLLLAVFLGGCAGVQVTEQAITANYLQPAAEKKGWLDEEYFVRDWLVLGPYQYDADKFGGEWGGQDATDVAFVKDESALTPKEGTRVEGKAWKRYRSEAHVDLDSFYDGIEYAVAYLGTYVYSPAKIKNCTLYIGSDDYIKVYINEKLVHTYKEERRAAEMDNDEVTGITLKKGWNKIVVKVVDVVFDWAIYLRFADSNGNPMKVLPEKSPF